MSILDEILPKTFGANDPSFDNYSDYVNQIAGVVSDSSDRLKNLKVLVIGAGPAGLVFSRAASNQGANVTVLEKANDPRIDDSAYTNRSFNLTLDDVGRTILADKSAWEGGIWLKGRAIHNYQDTGKIYYSSYGDSSTSHLVSIPRSVLRKNLCNLAEENCVELEFGVDIKEVDANNGSIKYFNNSRKLLKASADLIVYADGVHSLANDTLIKQHNADIELRPESRQYINGLVGSESGSRLDQEYIHFWHESDTENFAIGIPNQDKTFACLLVSPDYSETMSRPFGLISKAEQHLKCDFSSLWQVAPCLAGKLVDQRCGRFWYKTVSQFRVGHKGVLVGDAGVAFPPWAGFGANQAMFSASLLVHLLVNNNLYLNKALNMFDKQQVELSELLRNFASDQGDFLSGPVRENPSGRSDPALGPLTLKSHILASRHASTGRLKHFKPYASLSRLKKVHSTDLKQPV